MNNGLEQDDLEQRMLEMLGSTQSCRPEPSDYRPLSDDELNEMLLVPSGSSSTDR